MVTVSVIIPSYNSDKYLSKCIESVINQTFSDLEIIIVDGFSSDNSRDIILDYSNKDPRIKYFFHERNLGVSKARNDGIAISNGDFIAILDSDDVLAPTRIEELHNALCNHTDCCIAHTDVLIIDAAGHVTGKIVGKVKYSSGNIRGEVLRRRGCHIGYPMIRKKCINSVGGYDETLQGGEDYDLYTRLTRDNSVAYIQKPLLLYRRHSSNASSKHRLMVEHYKKYLDKTFKEDVELVYASVKYEAYSHYIIDKINIDFHENIRYCLINLAQDVVFLINNPSLISKMAFPLAKVGIFRIQRKIQKKYAMAFNKDYEQVGW